MTQTNLIFAIATLLLNLNAVRVLRRERRIAQRIARGMETAEEQRRRLAREQRADRIADQLGAVALAVVAVLGLGLVGIVLLLCPPLLPPLSLTEAFLLLILMEMRGQQKESTK